MKKNLDELLNNLTEISDWFENQEEVDIETGLQKVKEATFLLKEIKERLEIIENEFKEIKKDL
ncbi:MAG: hypothetical protein PHO04_00985 [Candidatus Pacebacteria bacterium]|jgi:hypothetical protein|nr:hypothetical protein [Candidatus Paceibacterota bacterium]NMB47511.1 hypothetical protein [Patescibacteria group bacterium]MDD2796548.1 hypothetical protein [Candidatus Paceibacterota bacterium]MDD3047795.1 hypothetical protein [Candidatus Paceibacterota bacterium]MDD3509719.1 hypothetical protein [Candidatus Paceibacterota bacterium]